jgi:hypothetical protein
VNSAADCELENCSALVSGLVHPATTLLCWDSLEKFLSQLFGGVTTPIVLSYFLERWQHSSFVKQLRSEAAISGGQGARAQPAPGTSAPVSVELSSGSEQPQIADEDHAGAIVDSADGYSGSAPMLADMLLLGAILPLMCAVGWQLLGICFGT